MIAYTQVFDRNHHRISIKNKDGIDPIELATTQGNDAAQRVLTAVARSSDVVLAERVDMVSKDAIAKAVKDGDEASVRILTEALVWKIVSEDEKPREAVELALSSPLRAAVDFHQNDIFDFLVDTASPYYKSVQRLMEHATRVDNDHALQFFLNHNHSGRDRLTELLNAAAAFGSIKVARILAEAGADVRGSIDQVIRSAREKNSKDWTQMLRLLTEHGAEVSRYQQKELTKLDVIVVLNNHSDVKLALAN